MCTIETSELQTFTLFPKLPIEIRFMIWEYALPGPRVVNLKQKFLKPRMTIGAWEDQSGRKWPIAPKSSESNIHADGGEEEYITRERARVCAAATQRVRTTIDNYESVWMMGLVSEALPPHIVAVCKESRGVVARFYTKSFGSAGHAAVTWFNPEIDTLYLGHNFSIFSPSGGYCVLTELKGGFRIADVEELRKIKKLAISIEMDPDESKDGFALEVLQFFDQLNKLSLISGEYDGENYGEPCVVNAETPIHRRELVLTDEYWGLDIPGLDMEFMKRRLEERVQDGLSCPKLPAIAFKRVFMKHDVEQGNHIPKRR